MVKTSTLGLAYECRIGVPRNAILVNYELAGPGEARLIHFVDALPVRDGVAKPGVAATIHSSWNITLKKRRL